MICQLPASWYNSWVTTLQSWADVWCDVDRPSKDADEPPISLFFSLEENKDSCSWLEWIWRRAQKVDSSNYCWGSTKELELELSPGLHWIKGWSHHGRELHELHIVIAQFPDPMTRNGPIWRVCLICRLASLPCFFLLVNFSWIAYCTVQPLLIQARLINGAQLICRVNWAELIMIAANAAMRSRQSFRFVSSTLKWVTHDVTSSTWKKQHLRQFIFYLL